MKLIAFLITFFAALLSVSFSPNGNSQTAVTVNCCPKAQHITPLTPTFTDSLKRLHAERRALEKDSKAKREKIDKFLKQSKK
jgi:hypothetical protein